MYEFKLKPGTYAVIKRENGFYFLVVVNGWEGQISLSGEDGSFISAEDLRERLRDYEEKEELIAQYRRFIPSSPADMHDPLNAEAYDE